AGSTNRSRIVTCRLFVAACVLAVGLTCASGQTAAPDAGAALPPGHPDLSALMGPTTQPALPEGHPALPPGHPAMPASGDAGAPGLPSGHPDIGALMNKPAATS